MTMLNGMKKSVPHEPPKRSVLEEVGNAVTHGTGAILGIAGLVLLLTRSRSGIEICASLIYGISLIIMFLMSCLYHSFKWGTKVKRLWRRFDYISIYLLIGGTFSPLWLLYWKGNEGVVFCIIEWGLILAGIALIAVFGTGKALKIHMSLYVALGWCGIVFMPKMIREDLPLFFYILTGGLLYTLGIIPFAAKKKGSHFIWHIFVLFGAVVHWFGIYLFLYAPG